MIKLALIALSSALVSTSPAAAEGTRAAESVAAASVVSTVVLPVARPAATQRYCIVDTITGSLIARRMCHTRDQWLGRGFDPVAAK